MSSVIDLRLQGDGAIPELADGRPVHHISNGATVVIAGLDAGMASGRASVSIKFDLEDGSHVLLEMSLRAFLMAARGLEARFGSGQ